MNIIPYISFTDIIHHLPISLKTFKKHLLRLTSNLQWLVPSKQPVNPPEEKLPVSNWLPKLHGKVPLQPEVSRSPIVIVLEQSPFEKSEDTKRALNFSSENCPSNGW